jgi:DNA-binding SARP family transcriptional activator
MHNTFEYESAEHPRVRIMTLGEFALERLVPAPSRAPDEPPRYELVARHEWSNRGPAMALLKVLLCRPNRRASRDELIETIWPDHGAINAAHALESAASVLRRHILRTGEVGSLLLTLRSGGETIFKLAGQHRLWVDADALLSLVSKAMRAVCQGQNPLPLLEEAHALAGGEFLEDDLYAEWAQGRRHTINGARQRVLFNLVDLYLKDERVGLAEELLFATLEEDPADEDALCRLMVLLVQQERRQEALHLYQYTEDVLQEEQAEPGVYTRELAQRIRQGLVLRERGERYTVVGPQTLSQARQDVVSRDHRDGLGVKRARVSITAAPCRGQTPSSYRYHLPRRRSRRQAAPPLVEPGVGPSVERACSSEAPGKGLHQVASSIGGIEGAQRPEVVVIRRPIKLRQAAVGQHGEVRPPAQTHRDGRDRHLAKVQLGLGRDLHVFGRFLQIREDLPVYGGMRGRDEAVGCLILFNALLPVSRINGELIIDVDC